MKTLTVEPILSDEEVKKLEGEFLNESYIKHLLTEDTIVYNEKKEPLAVFRKNCIPSNVAEQAYHSLKKAKQAIEVKLEEILTLKLAML